MVMVHINSIVLYDGNYEVFGTIDGNSEAEGSLGVVRVVNK